LEEISTILFFIAKYVCVHINQNFSFKVQTANPPSFYLSRALPVACICSFPDMNCSPELRGPPGRHFSSGDLWSPHRPQPPSTAAGWSGPRSLNMSGRENPQPAYNYPTTRRESDVWQTSQLRSRPASRHESLMFSGPRRTASQRPPDAASCRLWGRQHFPMVSFSRCAYRGSHAVLQIRIRDTVHF
jgi:hypothetical protein